MQSFKYATIVLACLLGSCLWLWIGLSSVRDTADAAAYNLVECQKIARRINNLRLQPGIATREVKEEGELSSRLENLASRFGIQRDAITSIEPHSPRRIRNSNYVNRSTTVKMQNVTLQQTIQVLLGLDDGASEMKITELQFSFTASRGSSTSNGPESWEVDFTVSYLLYSPRPDDLPPSPEPTV
jgi:hypothetical protein